MTNLIAQTFDTLARKTMEAEQEVFWKLVDEAMRDAEKTCRGYAKQTEQTRDVEQARGLEPSDRQVQIDTALHLADIFSRRDWRKRFELEKSLNAIKEEN